MKNKFYKFELFPFHITAKCLFPIWPQMPMNQLWLIFSKHLSELSHQQAFSAHAFVLMRNHFHLLSSMLKENTSEAARLLLKKVEESFAEFLGEKYQIFSDDLWIHEINNIKAYHEAYKYIYRNPINAGQVQYVQDYRYSSLRHILGYEGEGFPCVDNMNLISNPHRLLSWLNQPQADAYIN